MSDPDQRPHTHGDSAAEPMWAAEAHLATLGTPRHAFPIEHILLPLDLSLYSERAIPYALALAQATNASITLAYVADPDSAHPRSVSLPTATAYLTTIRETLLIGGAQRVALRVIRGTSVTEALDELAKLTQSAVVVIATHARQGIEQRVLGNVGDHLVRRGAASVLLVPPELTPSQSPTTYRRILAPLDGSALAERALEPVLTLARHAREPMDIVLFFVGETRDARDDGLRYVTAARAALLKDDTLDSVNIIPASVIGSPPGAIVGVVTHGVATAPFVNGPFDLLVMATHGRGGLQRMRYGSVAAYVMPRLTIPALIVHPAEHQAV